MAWDFSSIGKVQNVLTATYFQRNDVVMLARDLLGKALTTNINGQTTTGIITETEAYAGISDRASHAFNGRFTKRTSVMYQKGGIAYIFLIYGIHHLFNFVTNVAGKPDAVLLRGILPFQNKTLMAKRLGIRNLSYQHTDGPGKASKALGISTSLTGESLEGPFFKVWDVGLQISYDHIVTGPRVGVAYAGEDAFLPYRFKISPTIVHDQL